MEVKFLKAGNGDSILIHYKKFNILIDGGNDSRFLDNEIKKIFSQEQAIDLLIITHHDDDHIKGIINLLENAAEGHFGEAKSFFKKVIFNSPKKILERIPKFDDHFLSYKQAYKVEILLTTLGINWEGATDCSEPINFEGLVINFLSPLAEDLKIYADGKGAYLSSDFRCDWKSSLRSLNSFLSDDSKDNSVPNLSSVVVSIADSKNSFLFTGDVTPLRLESILFNLSKTTPNKKVLFDYVKLPHHGSYRSLTEASLSLLDCRNFIISTNSKKYFLPNKRALLKVLKHIQRRKGEKINFFFNYSESIDLLDIQPREQKEYNFQLIPNNQVYGLCI